MTMNWILLVQWFHAHRALICLKCVCRLNTHTDITGKCERTGCIRQNDVKWLRRVSMWTFEYVMSLPRGLHVR